MDVGVGRGGGATVDDDDLRRGRPTCHVRFDEATAILAGDALQTLAFQTIAEDVGLEAATRIALIAELSAQLAQKNALLEERNAEQETFVSLPECR